MPDKSRRNRIQATTLNEKQLRTFIAALAGPRASGGSSTGRFRALHERIRLREAHFNNAEEADQKLPAPHEDVEPYQSDAPRRLHGQLVNRLTETRFTLKVTPAEETTAGREAAERWEKILDRGIELVEERESLNIQGALADGQIIDCYGVLHWQLAPEVWPDMPDADEVDELPKDKDERERYEAHANEKGHHEEKATSRRSRLESAKAKAGFPVYIEVVHPSLFSFVPDRSMLNGMGLAMIIRSTPVIDYEDKLAATDKLYLGTVAVNQHAKKLRVFAEHERPGSWEPSSAEFDNWSRTVQVAEFWTRDEYYELVSAADTSGGSGDWTLVKSHKHPYEMPPFTLAEASHINTPDIALAYQPALAGTLRLKPFYDRTRTLFGAIVEDIARPFFWIKMADDSFMLDDSGKRKVFSRYGLAEQALPAGSEIVKVEQDMNPALVELLKLDQEELAEASPNTGHVDVGASTQPWTLRMAQDIANSDAKKLKLAQAKAIRTMLRNITLVCSKSADDGGLGESIDLYVRGKSGSLDRSKIVTITPEELEGLDIDVTIDPNSASQVIANVEHSRAWVADPNMPFTPRDLLEEAMRVGNPDEVMERWTADKLYREPIPNDTIQGGVLRQELAKRFGDAFVLTPGLDAVDSTGTLATPEDVLATQGFTVQQPPAVPPMAPEVAVEGRPMNALPDLRTPGVIPDPGIPG